MRVLSLANDWDIHRESVQSRGVTVTGVAARGFLSATPHGTAIHASLEVPGTITNGDFIVTLQGTDLTTHLGPLLDAAELAGQLLTLYDRVVVDTQDYSDYFAVLVRRSRMADTS